MFVYRALYGWITLKPHRVSHQWKQLNIPTQNFSFHIHNYSGILLWSTLILKWIRWKWTKLVFFFIFFLSLSKFSYLFRSIGFFFIFGSIFFATFFFTTIRFAMNGANLHSSTAIPTIATTKQQKYLLLFYYSQHIRTKIHTFLYANLNIRGRVFCIILLVLSIFFYLAYSDAIWWMFAFHIHSLGNFIFFSPFFISFHRLFFFYSSHGFYLFFMDDNFAFAVCNISVLREKQNFNSFPIEKGKRAWIFIALQSTHWR